MSFIELKKSFFVKNKLRINDKIFYRNSDKSTWKFDNVLDCKNIIENINKDQITIKDFPDSGDSNSTLESVKDFFTSLEQSQRDAQQSVKDIFINNSDKPDNDNIKLHRFKNEFGIKRRTFRFLTDDDFVHKKNAVKNGLYRNYNQKGLDLQKNLEFGFCNYNTINFFSYTDFIKHKNLICYANPYNNNISKNLYDFNEGNFTLNFRVIFRSLKNLETPNCLVHIPGLMNVYFSITKNNKIRISATSKENTYKNILDINEDINSILKNNINDNEIDEDSILIQDGNSALIEINNWYNITIKSNNTGVIFYIDGKKVIETEVFGISNLNVDGLDYYVVLGNSINYSEEDKSIFVKKYFDLFFNKNSLNPEYASVYNKDIYVSVEYENDYNTESFNYNSTLSIFTESFHGEISDIRIYNKPVSDEDIVLFPDSYVNDLVSEKEKGLMFYVPVLYVPAEVSANQVLLAVGKSDYVNYQGYYNYTFANTCGGLELNIGNYLIDFINDSKPNVVINAAKKESFYKNNINISTFFNENDFNRIKVGETLSEIYYDNLHNMQEYSEDYESNLVYNNLFVLPNDNGIPSINFNIINQLALNTNLSIDKKFFKSINGSNEYYFNITCENILNEDTNNFNIINYERISSSFDQNLYNNNFKIGDDYIRYPEPNLPIFDLSNIIYHDEEMTTYNKYIQRSGSNLLRMFNKIKNQYRQTESNPTLRNVFTDKLTLIDYKLENNILYKKTPLPYSDFNKNQDNLFISIFDISTQMYNKKIKKTKFSLIDNDFKSGKITLKDNGYYNIYRSDCNTKVADWNYVGHIFYQEGIVCLNNPSLFYFGKTDFDAEFEAESFLNVKEINIPADAGIHNLSQNSTYDESLRVNEAAFNSEEGFVYITDINLHDENYNIVAKAKLANPVPKKNTDRLVFRLKMDF